MRAKFAETDFLAAALAIAVEHGPAAATVASISDRLKAPTGSFYHRFASRDVLLGNLWLKTILDFQQGVSAALDAGDGLAAALHTPSWAREHLDEAMTRQSHSARYVHLAQSETSKRTRASRSTSSMPSCAKAIVLPAWPPWWNGASPPLTRCFRIYAVRSHTASARL
jgi:AcrR family transcriptional regulator